MNVVDLHPEDLIDKLESGSLTADERARLEAHLGACAECRFEVSVRAALADEAVAPRPPVPGPIAPPKEAPVSRPPSSRRSLPPRRALLFPAVAAALVAGGALAAVVSEVVRARQDDVALRRLEAPLHQGRPKRDGKKPRVERAPSASEAPAPGGAPAPAPEASEPVAPVPAPEPAGAPATETERSRRDEATTGRVESAATAPRKPYPHAAPTPSAQKDPPADVATSSAAALFGAANRARRYGDAAQAMALYRTLQDRFPASEEARLSRATLAALALDVGDPGVALESFDRYLEQDGAALGAEALVGRAVALQKLGRFSAELAAWKEVARRFPDTVHGRRAAARIAALSAR